MTALGAAATATPGAAGAPVTFSKYAAPTGLDTNAGTLAAPYKTMHKLFENLLPGQTGAMRGGTYGNNTTYEEWLKGSLNNGTAGNPITITCYPGETPLIKGHLIIDASYVTLNRLTMDGTNSLGSPNCAPGDTNGAGIYGGNIIIEYCDYYQSVQAAPKGVAFYVGGGTNNIFRYNKIHDFGNCGNFDHGVYAGHCTGVDVHHNWIWNNTHGWGIQVYPASVNGTFHHNVIDACGSGFVISDNGSATCTGNTVDHNVIVNSVGLSGVSSGAGLSGIGVVAGTGNSFTTNDCFNNPEGVTSIEEHPGTVGNIAVSSNITTDPLFVDAANHNYAVQAGSPVAGWGLATATGPLA